MDKHVEAVQRMQDYIEAHLDENITMANLANVSLYSPWHSYRLFVDLLHMTPAVYIRRLRLSKSALRLRDEKVKIIDIAFDTGFESVDGYQRAFYKEFGCNPYKMLFDNHLHFQTLYQMQYQLSSLFHLAIEARI